jgi:NADPH2:quinone reductase
MGRTRDGGYAEYTRVHGVVCFTGMLSNQWTVRDFYPIDYLPRGVRLAAYGGDASDLPHAVLQTFLDAVADGHATVPVHASFTLDEIRDAHTLMETGGATGKLVVTLRTTSRSEQVDHTLTT